METNENNNQEGTPPIIIKKVSGGHGHHGGAWKVAYADFVTAMMALFIVLWVLGQSEEVKEAVSSYFKDPVGFMEGGNKSLFPGLGDGLLNPGSAEEEFFSSEGEKEFLEKMGERILADLSENVDLSTLSEQVSIEFTNDGLRIEMTESEQEAFFNSGSSSLNRNGKKILRKIGAELAKIPNSIVIEGHTDARPYSSRGRFYTNFELSTDRANSARRELLAGGLKYSKIAEIRGHADRLLKDRENPYSEVNRRITITVKYKKSE